MFTFEAYWLVVWIFFFPLKASHSEVQLDRYIPQRPWRGQEGPGSRRADLLSSAGLAVSLAQGWDRRTIISGEKCGLVFSLTFFTLKERKMNPGC